MGILLLVFNNFFLCAFGLIRFWNFEKSTGLIGRSSWNTASERRSERCPNSSTRKNRLHLRPVDCLRQLDQLMVHVYETLYCYLKECHLVYVRHLANQLASIVAGFLSQFTHYPQSEQALLHFVFLIVIGLQL